MYISRGRVMMHISKGGCDDAQGRLRFTGGAKMHREAKIHRGG